MNYVRNSVKAVVDAYDGTTTFYVFDSEDPIIARLPEDVPGALQGRLRRCPRDCARTCAIRRRCSGSRPTSTACTT